MIRKFGLDHGKASEIAGGLIPTVLSKFIHKTNDPTDKSFDLQSILTNLTGGAGLNDILGKNGTNNGNKEEGGIVDKIKGMFN